MKRNYEESVCKEEKIFFSGRRIGQFAYLSGRKELVAQKRNLFVKKKRLFKKTEYKRICQKEKNILVKEN